MSPSIYIIAAWAKRPCHARGAQIDSPGAGRAVKRTGEGELKEGERLSDCAPFPKYPLETLMGDVRASVR